MGNSISLRAALFETLLILRANPIHAMLVLLISIILYFGMFPYGGITNPKTLAIVTVFVKLPALFLYLWTMPGMSLMAMRAASGESWNARLMFAGGRWIGRYLGILMVIFLPLAIIATFQVVFYPMLLSTLIQQVESYSELVDSDLARGGIANQIHTIFSPWGPLVQAGSNILFAAVWAAFSFPLYLAIDKEMGVSNAIRYGFELVRSIYPKALVWHVLIFAPNSLLFYVPGFEYWSLLLSESLLVISTFVLAILYRERLRQWEAEAGQPLRHESMLSLPRETSDETGLPDNLSGA